MKRFSRPKYFLLIALAVPFAVTVASAVPADRTQTPFSNYQPILDRMPFGAEVPVAAAADPAQAQDAAQVKAEQQKLAQKINMSCVNVTPDGTTAIGFTDLSDKTPVNYYLLVGATGGGWTVLSADYDDEWAQIKKDDITITLKLGKGLIDAPPVSSRTSVAQTAPPASPLSAAQPVPATAQFTNTLRPGLLRRPAQAGLAPVPGILAAQMAEMQKTREELSKIRESGGDVKSYMERLRERKAHEMEERSAAEQSAREQLQSLAAKITEDELKKKEREMNLRLLEQGAKPISAIELTPEEEQALVDKGVLAR